MTVVAGATVAYAVGAGGTAGVGADHSGGAGGSGYIIVSWVA